jgi:hypothetical protein
MQQGVKVSPFLAMSFRATLFVQLQNQTHLSQPTLAMSFRVIPLCHSERSLYVIPSDPIVSFRPKSRNLGPVGYRKGDDLLRFWV